MQESPGHDWLSVSSTLRYPRASCVHQLRSLWGERVRKHQGQVLWRSMRVRSLRGIWVPVVSINLAGRGTHCGVGISSRTVGGKFVHVDLQCYSHTTMRHVAEYITRHQNLWAAVWFRKREELLNAFIFSGRLSFSTCWLIDLMTVYIPSLTRCDYPYF